MLHGEGRDAVSSEPGAGGTEVPEKPRVEDEGLGDELDARSDPPGDA